MTTAGPVTPELVPPRKRRRLPLPSFTAFRYRDFRFWWLSSVTMMLDRGMAQIAIAWLVLELTDSSVWVGASVFATGLPVFLFTIPAGIVADRWDRRRMLLVVQTIAGALALLFALVVGLGLGRPAIAVGFAFLSGSMLAFGLPTSRALIPVLVPKEHVVNAVAWGAISQNTSRLIGPALAGVLIAAFGVAASFVVQAVLVFLGALALAAMRAPGPAPKKEGAAPRSVMGDLREGGRFLVGHPPLLVIVGLMVATGLFMMGPHQTVLPIIVRDYLDAGSAGFGVTATAMSLGGITTSLALTSMGDMRNKGGFFAMALIGGSACFVGYVLAPSFALALVFFYVWGAFGGFFANMSQALLQTHTPGEIMGRVMAVNTIAMQGFMPLGALQAGLVAALAGPQAAAISSAVLCAVLAMVALVAWPSFRRLR